jgi:hypothetical protein
MTCFALSEQAVAGQGGVAEVSPFATALETGVSDTARPGRLGERRVAGCTPLVPEGVAFDEYVKEGHGCHGSVNSMLADRKV